jgi:hypothetical protein
MRWLLTFCVIALTGCADPHLPLTRDYSNSVTQNVAAQTFELTPVDTGPTTTDGRRIASAIERYKTNKTYAPHLPLDTGRIHSLEPEEREQ